MQDIESKKQRTARLSAIWGKAKYHSNPEYRLRKLETQKLRYADPEFQQNSKAYQKIYRDARKDNPEWIEKRNAYAKAYRDGVKHVKKIVPIEIVPIEVPKVSPKDDTELMEILRRVLRGNLII